MPGEPDFTDREVQLLARARPHLMQAYRNAELRGARQAMLVALEQGLDTLGKHVVVLDLGGRVEFATDGAHRLLGNAVTNSRRLPEAVRDWISQHRGPRAAAAPLLLDTAEGTLLVRLLPNKRTDRREMLLLESGTEELSVIALCSLGLTTRQAETLRSAALGHTTSQTVCGWGSRHAPSRSTFNTSTRNSAYAALRKLLRPPGQRWEHKQERSRSQPSASSQPEIS